MLVRHSHLLLFGVASYADMPAYTGFRDLIHRHVAELSILATAERSILGLNPWRACYWVVPDCPDDILILKANWVLLACLYTKNSRYECHNLFVERYIEGPTLCQIDQRMFQTRNFIEREREPSRLSSNSRLNQITLRCDLHNDEQRPIVY